MQANHHTMLCKSSDGKFTVKRRKDKRKITPNALQRLSQLKMNSNFYKWKLIFFFSQRQLGCGGHLQCVLLQKLKLQSISWFLRCFASTADTYMNRLKHYHSFDFGDKVTKYSKGNQSCYVTESSNITNIGDKD